MCVVSCVKAIIMYIGMTVPRGAMSMLGTPAVAIKRDAIGIMNIMWANMWRRVEPGNSRTMPIIFVSISGQEQFLDFNVSLRSVD